MPGSHESWSDRKMKAQKLCTLTCICTWIDQTCKDVKKRRKCKTKLLEWMVSFYHIDRLQPLVATMSKNAERAIYLIKLLEKEKNSSPWWTTEWWWVKQGLEVSKTPWPSCNKKRHGHACTDWVQIEYLNVIKVKCTIKIQKINKILF